MGRQPHATHGLSQRPQLSWRDGLHRPRSYKHPDDDYLSRQPTNDRDGKALLEELVPILWILDELGVDWQRQDPSFPRNSLTGHCVVTHRFDMFRE